MLWGDGTAGVSCDLDLGQVGVAFDDDHTLRSKEPRRILKTVPTGRKKVPCGGTTPETRNRSPVWFSREAVNGAWSAYRRSLPQLVTQR